MDIDKLILHSDFPPDKIVHLGEINVINSGVTTYPLDMRIVEERIPNPYIRKAFVRYVWTVTGNEKNGPESKMLYSFTFTSVAPLPPDSGTVSAVRGMVAVGVNDDEIIFRTGSAYHGNVVDNGTTYSYTPISQTFNIKYALFEME